MKAASLIHIETGVEYYKDGSLLNPSTNEKLMWAIYGLPEGIEKNEKTFETEIDEFIGFNEKEIKYRLSENIKNGLYNYLPSDGCLELRVRSSQNLEDK